MSNHSNLTNHTNEPSEEGDGTTGIIVSCLVGGPILLAALCFISYMLHQQCFKPWYKNIKNRIKTYYIWVLKKKRVILNTCFQDELNREIRNRELRRIEPEISKDNGKVKKLNKKEKCNIDSNEICSICYEEIGTKKISKLVCGHLFHQKCITEWTQVNENNNNCPFCRAEIENDMFIV